MAVTVTNFKIVLPMIHMVLPAPEGFRSEGVPLVANPCLLFSSLAIIASVSGSLSAQQIVSIRITDQTGAVIAGATVQVRSANGTVQRTTQSDTNGSSIISGLAAGNYRLVLSNPGFETKEIPVTIGTTGATAPLRISLAVGSVSTTVKRAGPGG